MELATQRCWLLLKPCVQVAETLQKSRAAGGCPGENPGTWKAGPFPPAPFQCLLLRELSIWQLAKENYFRVQLHYHRAIDLELRGNNLITGTWNTEPGVP